MGLGLGFGFWLGLGLELTMTLAPSLTWPVGEHAERVPERALGTTLGLRRAPSASLTLLSAGTLPARARCRPSWAWGLERLIEVGCELDYPGFLQLCVLAGRLPALWL